MMVVMMMIMMMMMIRGREGGGGGRRWLAQMQDKYARTKMFQESSLTVKVLITNPLNVFASPLSASFFSFFFFFWDCDAFPACESVCPFCFALFGQSIPSCWTNPSDSIRVNRKTSSKLLCKCDRKGCTKNKEFELMDIGSLGPPCRCNKRMFCCWRTVCLQQSTANIFCRNTQTVYFPFENNIYGYTNAIFCEFSYS